MFDLENFVLGMKPEKGVVCQQLRMSGWEIAPLTLERIRYTAFEARVSFEIGARSKKLVLMPPFCVCPTGGCRVVARPLSIASPGQTTYFGMFARPLDTTVGRGLECLPGSWMLRSGRLACALHMLAHRTLYRHVNRLVGSLDFLLLM